MEPFRHHVFVCTQQKPEDVPSCPHSGSENVLKALENTVMNEGIDDDVQISTCGCLGLCDEAPIMIVYPEGVWYRKLTQGDVGEIVRKHLRGGKPVSRLVWKQPKAMKAMAVEHRNRYRAMIKAKQEEEAVGTR